MLAMARECAHSVLKHLDTDEVDGKFITKGWGDSGRYTQGYDSTSGIDVEVTYSENDGFDLEVKYVLTDANYRFFNTALTNLLYNAIKYFHEANVRAILEEREEDEEND